MFKKVGIALLRLITSKAAILALITTGALAIGAKVAPETADQIATTLAALADSLTGVEEAVVTE